MNTDMAKKSTKRGGKKMPHEKVELTTPTADIADRGVMRWGGGIITAEFPPRK